MSPKPKNQHMKYLSAFSVAAALFFAAGLTLPQKLQGKDAPSTSSDPAIVGKLREIVAVHQRLTESNQRAIESGKGDRDGRYEVALAEARLKLARELGERNEQIAALRDILKVQLGRLQVAKMTATKGSMSSDEVDTIRVAALEAEVMLLRAQKDSGKP